MEKDIYNRNFYVQRQAAAEQSARETIPLILELIQPRNVVDVGCGLGTWLSVFKEFGIQECLGIDGDYVNPAMLLIPATEFLAHDLKRSLQLNKKFDLVVSLEVAEHLPEAHAETFVESLTGLGDVVLFSAAIPFQGGTGHLNEQWPEYWAQRFRKRGYVVVDCLRAKLWYNEKVKPWYAQNIFFYVKQDCLGKYPRLAGEFVTNRTSQLGMIHPKIYLRIANELQRRIRKGSVEE